MSKPRYSRAVLTDMYINRNMSQRAIGRALGISYSTVHVAMRRWEIEARGRTSTRVCWCGADVEKRLSHRPNGCVLSGTMCRKHRLAHLAKQQRERRARK